MITNAVQTPEELVASARRLKYVEVSWLQTFVSLESYASYVDAVGVMNVISKTVYERIDSLEKNLGYVISSEDMEFDTTSVDSRRFKEICEGLLRGINRVAEGKLFTGTDDEKRAIRGLSIDDMRTFILIPSMERRKDAARYFSIDESTLSRRLTNVEKAFGRGPLFDKISAMTLTREGKEVFSLFKVILKKLCKFKGQIVIADNPASSEKIDLANTNKAISIVRRHYARLIPALHEEIARVRKAKRSNREKDYRVEELCVQLKSVQLFDAELEKTAFEYQQRHDNSRVDAGIEALRSIEEIWKKEEALVNQPFCEEPDKSTFMQQVKQKGGNGGAG